MQKVLVRIYFWDNPKLLNSEISLQKGDQVVAQPDQFTEMGEVLEAEVGTRERAQGKVLRVATERDKKKHSENENKKVELLNFCREGAKKLELDMKFIDARTSLDGKQITFAFSADSRIDFRELVKILSAEFKKSIKMQQIGSRDEARKLGGFGICGRELCCVKFQGNMQSITTEMARIQQVAHRGSERISGLCGRLMCCLSYEASQYKEALKGMPELHSVITTSKGKGTVVELNAVLQEIKIRTEDGKYEIVKKEDIK
jgi:cell fate regulator YaaT (PSP1 superfamily)